MGTFLNEVKSKQATLCCAKKVCSTWEHEAEGQQLRLAASLCLRLNVTHIVTSAHCHTVWHGGEVLRRSKKNQKREVNKADAIWNII